MTPTEAFTTLVRATLYPSKARRYGELASTPKGQKKLLDALAHRFEDAIRPDTIVSGATSRMRNSKCYVFHYNYGYGREYPTVDKACDDLAVEDSWLIVLTDGSAGIHRPEGRWDDERVFAGDASAAMGRKNLP